MKNINKYSIIASICFFIYGVLLIFNKADTIDKILLIFGMSVVLLIKNKIAVVIMTGLNVLLCIISMFSWIYISKIFELVSWSALSVVIVLALNRSKIIDKVWIVPGTICLALHIIYWFGDYSNIRVSAVISVILMHLVTVLPQVVGFVFVGFWLKDEMRNVEINHNISSGQENLVANDVESIIGSADKLKTYKELLDIGAITQEEFDEKKSQILNLKEK